MTAFATVAPAAAPKPAKPEPKWLKERRAELAAARSRAARPATCTRCGGEVLRGQGEDEFPGRVDVDATPLPPERRTLHVVLAVLSGRPVYCRQYGALHRLDRPGLGLGPGDFALGLVREPVGPQLPLHTEHRCGGPS